MHSRQTSAWVARTNRAAAAGSPARAAVAAVSDAVAGDLAGSRLGMHLLVGTGLALLLVVARSQPAAPPAGDAERPGPTGRTGPGATPAPGRIAAGRARPARMRAGSAA